MPVDDLVELAARTVAEGIVARPWHHRQQLLIRIVDRGGEPPEVDVGFKEFEGHPAELLRGFVAPDEWAALGVSTTGWATHLDTGSRQRVRCTSLLTRAHAWCDVLEFEDGEVVFPQEPAVGLVADLMRRTFCLDTAPPAASVADLLGALWLKFALLNWRRPTWRQLQEIQPAAARVSAINPSDEWEDVRWRTVTGDLPWIPLTPEDAAWFDAGSFSRWVLGCYPLLDVLAELRRQVSGATFRRVVRELEGWGAQTSARDIYDPIYSTR